MKLRTLLLTLFALAACTSSESPKEPMVKGFNPPPPTPGYKRYVTPIVHQLMPGQDLLFCQWIDAPADADIDVVDVKGYQTATGHHAVLYSTSNTNEPIGTSRECTSADMVSVEFLGGIGGEGGGQDATKLPEGLVFRQRAGRALLANTHYLNATDQIMDVQSVIDVKLSDPSPANRPVGMAVLNYGDFEIPPNSTSYTVDTYCKWPKDTSVIMWSDHMHENGISISSDVKRASGAIDQLAIDPTWEYEEAFNPRWVHWDLNTPQVIHANDEVHVKCTWKNAKSSALTFPDEMCVGIGFYLESPELSVCGGKLH